MLNQGFPFGQMIMQYVGDDHVHAQTSKLLNVCGVAMEQHPPHTSLVLCLRCRNEEGHHNITANLTWEISMGSITY